MHNRRSSIDLVKKFWQFVSPFKFQLILVVILLIISSALLVYAPKILGRLVNSVLIDYMYDKDFNFSNSFLEILEVAGIYIVALALRIPINRIMSKISEKTTADFKYALHDKLNYLSPNTFNDVYSGNVLSRLNNDVANIKSFTNKSISLFLSDIFLIAFVIISTITLNFDLSMIFIVSLPFFALILFYSYKVTINQYKKHQGDLGYQMGKIGNILVNRVSIHSFKAKDYSKKEFVESNDIQNKSFFASRFYSDLTNPLAYLMAYIIQISMYLYAGYFLFNGNITLDVLTTFGLYVQIFKRPVLSLNNIFNSIKIGLSSFDRVLDVLEYPVDDEYDLKTNEEITFDEIEFKNISYNTFYNFNLKFNRGDIVNVVGENCNDFIDILFSFEELSVGKILLNNKSIDQYNLNSYRSIFGVSLEDDKVIAGTVADNIAFGGDDVSIDEVKNVCKLLEIDGLIEKLPQKYDTKISNDFQNFSSGEAKLICVARALVSNPQIVILNYPNYLTIDKLKSITSGKTAIILTPDDTLIDFADKTVYID